MGIDDKDFRLPDGRFVPGFAGGPGRIKEYPTPQALHDRCLDYFKWVNDNPLKEAQVISYKGRGELIEVPKMRAMTLNALCIHLGIGNKTWGRYRDNPDFSQVCESIEQVIQAQKFEGAAANLLNGQIISRDLGLSEKTELSGPGGGPINTVNSQTSPEDAARAYAELRELSRKT